MERPGELPHVEKSTPGCSIAPSPFHGSHGVFYFVAGQCECPFLHLKKSSRGNPCGCLNEKTIGSKKQLDMESALKRG